MPTTYQAFELGIAFNRLGNVLSIDGDGRDLGRIVDQRAEVSHGWREFSLLPESIQGHNWNQYSRGSDALVTLKYLIREWLLTQEDLSDEKSGE